MTADMATEQRPHFLRQVSRNALWLGVGYVVSRAMTLGMLMLLTRNLSMGAFGRFTMLTTLIGLCEIIPVCGVNQLAIRGIGKDPAAGWSDVPHFLGLVFVSSTFVASGLIAVVWYSGMSGDSFLLAGVTGLSVIPVAIAVVLEGALQGAQLMSWCAYGLILLSFGSFLTVVAAVLWQLDLNVIFSGFLISYCLRLCLLFYATPIRTFPQLIPTRWHSTLLAGAPYALSSVLGVLQLKLDLLFVAWLNGEAGAAIYGVAFKFVELAIFVSVIGTVALLPHMARLRESPQQFERAYILCLKIAALAALPITFLVFQNAELLLSLLFADQYLAARSTLRILAGVILVLIFHVPNWAVLLSAPEQRPTVVVSLVTILLNALLNVLWIPFFGPAGAAAAALCATVVGTLLSMYFIQKSFDSLRFQMLRQLALLILAGGAALLSFTYGALLYCSPLFATFIGLIGYVGVVMLVDSRDADQSLLTLCFPRFKATSSTDGVPTL
jgi:O-antigen/teichoic acid export membrane protein